MKMLAFRNGDRMPIVGLGTWKSAPGDVYTAVREAIRIGYRHIDCAAVYGNEAEVGRALRDAMTEDGVTRKDLFIVSKLWGHAHGRENVGPRLRQSLQDLGLEYLDLYLIHWPMPLKAGVIFPQSAADYVPPAEMPVHTTWAALEDAVHAGLTRHIGVSNFSVKKLSDLMRRSTIAPEVNQVEMHPLLQQPALVKYCASQGILLTAYSPLGSPDRPDIVKAAEAPVLLDNPVIAGIARAHGCTPAQILIAWQVQRGISVIPKSVTASRLRENLAAADITLTPADLEAITGLDRHYRLILGAFWVVPDGPWSLETIWDEA